MIPRTEAQKAFKARDAANSELRRTTALLNAIAGKVGIDPAEIEVLPTNDPANPFEVRGDALEKVGETLTAAQQARIDAQKKAGKWEDREKELNETWTKKLVKSTTDVETKAKSEIEKAAKRAAALEKWIDETAGDGPIREALLAESAVHDGKGNYDDLVRLIKPRVKREIAIDEETGKATVQFVPLSDDGTPLTDSKGQTRSVRDLVSEWLGQRPQFKQARMARGPGAGGRGPALPPMTGSNTPAERGFNAARAVFGDAFVPGQRT